jgi:ATP-binding cassette subfamily A (ABC1) protein 1
LDSDLQGHIELEVFTTICVIFALAFIPTSFLVFLIDERVTTSKHLQFVSGVKGKRHSSQVDTLINSQPRFPGWTYWSANFLWELTNYSVSIACCILIFLAFDMEAYVHKQNFLCFILLLFLYGFAIIPLMSPISYLFETPSTGFVLISCINVFIGLILTVSTIALDTMDDKPRLHNISPVLKRIFIIFPHYCLGRGLFDMSRLHATNVISAKYSQCYEHGWNFPRVNRLLFLVADFVPKSPLAFDLVGRNLLSLFIQGVVFSVFAILVQYRFFIADR